MTDETRRRQKREELKAKAARIIESDRERLRETIKELSGVRRNLMGPYTPERLAAEFDNLFGSKRRTGKIGN